MTVKEYHISNLNCAHCSTKIEESISNLEGVDSVNLDFIGKKLTVQFSRPISEPLKRLNLIASDIEPGVEFNEVHDAEAAQASPLPRILIGLGLLSLLASFFSGDQASFYLSILAWLLVGHRVLIQAIKKLVKARVFDEHLLMSVAGLGALYLGEFTEGIAVMLLYEIGQYFEAKAVDKSRRMIKKMLAVKPEKAHLIGAEGIEDLKLNQIQIGDLLAVYPGERIPLDGTVFKGTSSVDTSSLTGETEPVAIEPGSVVMGGFINMGGRLELEVNATEAESTVSRILKLIENASQRKSQTEKFITRFAKWYTPSVVAAAILLLVIPLLLGASFDTWLPRSLIFLIVSCPCALVISIPLTYYVAIGLAAKKGIIFKGSAYMDSLRRMKSFVFDKTGTLTTGKLTVKAIHAIDPGGEDDVWETVYRCEYSSLHPLAQAVKNGKKHSFDSRLVEEFTEFPGKGILMNYASEEYLAGSLQLLKDLGYTLELEASPDTAIYAIRNHRYIGYITFTDELKPGIKDALAKLKQMGVESLSMLSGDRRQKAELVAHELGLDAYEFELLPEHKLEKLEAAISRYPGATVYVGDGLNDAPVLAAADLGIAMGEIGNAASIEAADIVLLNDKPEQLVNAVRISHLSFKIVKQNLVLALGIKVIVMILGAFGLGHLWEAVIADVGVTILAVFNAMRLTILVK